MKSNVPTARFDSSSPLALDGLNEEQQQRLIGLLDGYLIGVEEGRTQDIESLVAEHPDLTHPLRQYLEGLHWLRQFKMNVDAEGLDRNPSV